MTIEERFEFLFQSIASHDQQIGALVESQARGERETAELRERMEKSDQRMKEGFERVQLNFDRLTTAMLGLTEHAADHQRRIKNLEGGL